MKNVTTENLKCEMAAEHIAVFTISRPRALNAMLMSFLGEAHELLDALEADKSVRCVILTGDGEKSFSAGGDLKEEMANAASNPRGIIDYDRLGDELCLKIRRSRIPFIAAVNGYAFGAPLGLIAACDLSLASESALFALPTPALGGIPGWGCTQTVTRLIGAHNAKRMLLSNERFDAREALRIGLVSKVTPRSELMPQALEAAGRIAAYAPGVMAIVKKTINDGLEAPTVEAALAIEHANLSRSNPSPVFVEGIAAFLEKRNPDFEGAAAGMKK